MALRLTNELLDKLDVDCKNLASFHLRKPSKHPTDKRISSYKKDLYQRYYHYILDVILEFDDICDELDNINDITDAHEIYWKWCEDNNEMLDISLLTELEENSNHKNKIKIPQKYHDIVSGFLRDSLYTQHWLLYNDDIKNIILSFFYSPIFESTLLNDCDKYKLLNLLEKNNKIISKYPWKLIYDSRKDGLEKDNFIEIVHGKPNILILIQLKGKQGSIVGGYTKRGWNKSMPDGLYSSSTDKDAFVFYLKSPDNYQPFISNIKQNEDAINNALTYYSKRDMLILVVLYFI